MKFRRNLLQEAPRVPPARDGSVSPLLQEKLVVVDASPLPRAASASSPARAVSHNQIGQKLGRKGLETRERIIAAMLRLVAAVDGPPVTLTSVANEAAVKLTNLYLYFPDMGELLLAALTRVMETDQAAYLDLLRERWPDRDLDAACLLFLRAHYDFWRRNARILHLRNALADANDLRVLRYRLAVTAPMIDLLQAQLDSEPGDVRGNAVATVLMTGLERVATVVTNPQFATTVGAIADAERGRLVENLVVAEAEVMAVAIRNRRAMAGQTTATSAG